MTLVNSDALRDANVPAQPVRRTVTWRSALIIALGASLLVVTSVGPIAADLGPASVFVWTATALIGLLHCLILADLGVRFPNKAGGTATYAHEAFKDLSPLLGAASNWAYWFAWTPGIAVNLLLAAQYLQAGLLPGSNTFVLAGALAIGLYALNACGLRPSIFSSGVLALCALIPLVGIGLAPLLRPELFHAEYIQPFVPRGGDWLSGGSWLRLLKWMFVAAWASYGAEMASNVVAELRDPQRDAPRSMGIAALVVLLAYAVVPLALLGMIGPDALLQDPAIALLPAARAVFGPAGASLVVLMLVAALLLGAHAFIIGSSRTLYQMSRDGLIIRQCARLNRFGVPIGSMIFDASVTLALLAIFQAHLLDIIAAANVGYIVVFVLLPLAWLRLRRKHDGRSSQTGMRSGFRLPKWFVPQAWLLATFNLVLLIIGGAQWGLTVIGVGVVGTLAFLPLYWLRRWQDR